jgi:toxin ParE1/3/4
MRVVLRRSALADLESIHAYIAADNPEAARKIVRRIRDRLRKMAALEFGELGRPGRIEGTRELVEAPYVITYRVDREANVLVVVAILHGAQRR